jgi:hypothetical protein
MDQAAGAAVVAWAGHRPAMMVWASASAIPKNGASSVSLISAAKLDSPAYVASAPFFEKALAAA